MSLPPSIEKLATDMHDGQCYCPGDCIYMTLIQSHTQRIAAEACRLQRERDFEEWAHDINGIHRSCYVEDAPLVVEKP